VAEDRRDSLGRDAHGVHVAVGGVAHFVRVPLAGFGRFFGRFLVRDARGLDQGAEGAAEVGGVDGGAGLGPGGAGFELLGGRAGAMGLERGEGDRQCLEPPPGLPRLGVALPQSAAIVLKGLPDGDHAGG